MEGSGVCRNTLRGGRLASTLAAGTGSMTVQLTRAAPGAVTVVRYAPADRMGQQPVR